MQSATLKILSALSLLAALSACQQAPAQVVMKGMNSYAKADYGTPNTQYQAPQQMAANDYVQAAPVAEVITAPTQGGEVASSGGGIQMTELAPLAKVEAMPLPTPQAPAMAKSKTMAEAPVALPVTNGNYIWPVNGKIISKFGSKPGGAYNDGINISGKEGEPIVAAADGDVVYSGNELKGYGNMVILRHRDGIMSAYAHADRIIVNKGDKVKQGAAIATVGKSGGVDQAQVHFGIRKNKEPVDPITYLAGTNLAMR